MLISVRLLLLFVTFLIFPSYVLKGSDTGVTALIVDSSGTEFHLTNLTYERGIYKVRGYVGFHGQLWRIIPIKKFNPRHEREDYKGDPVTVNYEVFPSYDKIKTISYSTRGEKYPTIKTEVELKDGSHYDLGEWTYIGQAPPIYRGKTDFGDLEISTDKIKFVTIKSGHPIKPKSKYSRKAVIELRDGTKVNAQGIRRQWWSTSRYINVPTEHYTENYLVMKVKKGEALFKREIPFEKIREMAFRKNHRIEVILKDGKKLSGHYNALYDRGDDPQSYDMDAIMGIEDRGVFIIEDFYELEAAIKSIKFID